jgi:hypothetical protein
MQTRSNTFRYHLALLLDRIRSKLQLLESQIERERLQAAEARIVDLIERYEERRRQERLDK